MRPNLSCTLIAALSITCGSAAALSGSKIPPPHAEVLIPAPRYALNSSEIASVDSLLRENDGSNTPGMNLYNWEESQHRPPVRSYEQPRNTLIASAYDGDSSEAYSVQSLNAAHSSEALRQAYEERAERVPRSSAKENPVMEREASPVYILRTQSISQPYFYFPYYYPRGFQPFCSTSVGVSYARVYGYHHWQPGFAMSCW